jgi:hypothetical protein
MNIQQEFDELVEWAKNSNILLIEGIINQNHSATVLIPNAPDAVSTLRTIAEKQKADIIFYDKTVLDTVNFSFRTYKVNEL